MDQLGAGVLCRGCWEQAWSRCSSVWERKSSYQINFGVVNIHPVSLVAIGLTLVAAIVISVLFALSPNHDPLSLSERGRMRYVYAAEVMLALLFLHIRLTTAVAVHRFHRTLLATGSHADCVFRRSDERGIETS